MSRFFAFAVLFSLAAVPVVQAQGIKVDDGIRNARSVVVGGNSVIDSVEVESGADADFRTSIPIPEEGRVKTPDADIESVTAPSVMLPENPVMPIEPYSPSAPKKNVKRVVKPYEQMKIRRSIQDDRIDDYYVQEMVKENHLFTPNLKK